MRCFWGKPEQVKWKMVRLFETSVACAPDLVRFVCWLNLYVFCKTLYAFVFMLAASLFQG
jgi:hypothetical protein